MNKQPMLLDCDTGVDDAVAILLAKHLQNLELVAVTSVAGNVEIEHTTENTLRVLELAGLGQIPVYRGAETEEIPTVRQSLGDWTLFRRTVCEPPGSGRVGSVVPELLSTL